MNYQTFFVASVMIMMVGRLKSWRPSVIHIDKNLLNGHYYKYRIKTNTRHDPSSTMKQYMTSSSIITTSDNDARHSINRRTSTTAAIASSVDTIFALSSGPIVKSGVAVIRLSGPMSFYCLERLLIKESPSSLSSSLSSSTTKSSSSFIDPMKGIKPRMAALRHLYSPQSNDVLDQALVLWFPAPRSFTGEDVVELHVHGSKAVIKGLFEAFEYIDDNRPSDDGGDDGTDHNGTVSSIGGGDAMSSSLSSCIRPAGPGEFTRRAFENGKMDLTEVEGLSDLLDAETSVQRRLALKQMDGHLRRQYEQWREVLIKCLAHTEAVIDFGDDDREGDINDDAMYALIPKVTILRDQLKTHLLDGRRGELVREGIRIALIGPPNAGKSSLMNALARRPAAIVSPIAGTTRDVIEVRMDLGGVPCIISDTAGLRSHSDDVIEIEGMKRARDAFSEAQVKIFVVDCSDKESIVQSNNLLQSLIDDNDKGSNNTNDVDDQNIIDNDADYDDIHDDEDDNNDKVMHKSRIIIVNNKVDLISNDIQNKNIVHSDNISLITSTLDIISTSFQLPLHSISCLTGSGINELEQAITNTILSILAMTSDGGANSNGGDSGDGGVGSIMITRERHRRHVKICTMHLENFLSKRLPMDAAAEELRLAMLELGKITGRVDVEELLDIIFRDFCIGK